MLGFSTNQMTTLDVTEQEEQEVQPAPTSEFFLALRRQYLANRTVRKGYEVLEKMLQVNVDEVEGNAWLDGKDLLTLIIEDIPEEDLLSNNQILLLNAIQMGSSELLSTLANLIIKKPRAIQLLRLESSAVAVAFARQLNDKMAFETIAKICGQLAENPHVVTELNDNLRKTTNVKERFHLYQVVQASFTAEAYKPSLKPLLDSLIRDLEDKNLDFLERLSIIEMLSDCATSNRHAAEILDQTGVTKAMYAYFISSKEAPEGGFLYSACIRFFGGLSRCYPESIKAFPDFVDSIVDAIRHFDLLDASQRLLVFDTFANMAYKMESKGELEKLLGEEKLKLVFQAYGAAINSGPVELRVRHMHAATLIFEESDQKITEKWIGFFGEPFPSLLIATVKRPFLDVKIAVMALMRTLFDYSNMILAFFRIPGFTEWLLDETSETEYAATIGKRELVRRILQAEEEEKNLLDEPLVVKLNEYLAMKSPEPQVELAL